MRILILVFSFLLALVGLLPAKADAAPAPRRTATRPAPVAARDWSTSIVVQPGGGVAVGNPAAKVQLVEWLSYTCSHCGEFARDSKTELHAMIRSGRVRVEYRALPRDALDLAAGLLVRCGGTTRFLANHDAIFAQQAAMFTRAEAYAATPAASVATATVGARLNQLADAAGLRALMRTRGLTNAQTTKCLNDEAAHKRLIAIAEAAQTAGVTGTPTFLIGGRTVDAHHWSELKPMLLAAGR